MSKLEVKDFRGVTTSLFSSSGKDAITVRQSSLSEYSATLKNALALMPPDVTKGLFADYKELPEEKVGHLMNAMVSKELMLDEITQGSNLEKGWLAGNGPGKSEELFKNTDDWNEPGWDDVPSL
jgi:hypothetical protein